MANGDDQEQFDRRFARVRAARDAFLKELNRDPAMPFHVITDSANPVPLGEDTALEVRFVIQPNPAATGTDPTTSTVARTSTRPFAYMSPEQVSGQPITPQSDIFSVGLLLYELLTNARVFCADTDFALVEQVRNCAIKSPMYYNAFIPPKLEQIVLRALTKDLNERYQTAERLLGDLQRFLDEARGSAYSKTDRATYVQSAFPEAYAKDAERMDTVRHLELDTVGTARAARTEAFGKYFLLERLAENPTAELFLAKTYGIEGFEKELAIKRLRPELARDKDVAIALIEAARCMITLNHPNIPQVYDLGKICDAYFVAKEWVRGVDFDAIIARSRASGEVVSAGFACAVIANVCEALDYAHGKKGADGKSAPIIHGNLHPRNVLVSFDGDVKVTDFRGAHPTHLPKPPVCKNCGTERDHGVRFCPSCGDIHTG